MVKKLLIDAAQPEEVRVAVLNEKFLEEFDSESKSRRQLKGNIYLAKVIRVEPSLQAAFVEYGGNRHGFLPFSEIHPDYYRIPVSDREKLLEAIEEVAKDMDAQEGESSEEKSEEAEVVSEESNGASESGTSEEDVPDNSQTLNFLRKKGISYKIQEVIQPRQIMLVQVVRDERGAKGAALTSYLSLPGRYCVLMPNAGHRGGGISRKINNGEDRKRLKSLVQGLEVPKGMSLIVRTAGQNRTKLEIRRDFEYLMRLWNDIRDTTIQSVAPMAVYNESDLIKRAIRDIYGKDIEEIIIEGDEAYKDAKAFMKTLMPSHTKKIKQYKDALVPLFYKYEVEAQTDRIMENVVQLPSGGSIVIGQTEALVAIDVNSGKSTRERNIDTTALKTNLEAAEVIAHHLRLRDLGGLVVIDFIDMQDANHINQVERRFKEATKNDRARIQIGRISQFGLLELSRQRLKPSLMESHSVVCHHCKGTGVVRSIESTALRVIRAIETIAVQKTPQEIKVITPPEIDLYLLNQKRKVITSIESRFSIQVSVGRDNLLTPPHFRIEIRKENEEGIMIMSGEEALGSNKVQDKFPLRKAKDTSKEKDSRNNKGKREKENNPQNSSRQKNKQNAESKPKESNSEVTENEEVAGDNGEAQGLSGRPNKNQRRRNRQRMYRMNRRRGGRPDGEQNAEGENKGESPKPLEKGDRVKESEGPKTEAKNIEDKKPKLTAKKAENKTGDESTPTKKSKGWLRRLLDS